MTRSTKNITLLILFLPLMPLLLAACFLFQTTPTTYDIALGDLDGDGDLDAFFANGQSEGLQPNAVWINNGAGKFVDSGQSLGNTDTHQVALGDLDDDSDLDAIEAGWRMVYLNDGHGIFSKTSLGDGPIAGSYTRHASPGDLDQDGDLDLFLAGCCGAFSGDQNDPWVVMPASTIEINDGSGRYNRTQRLSNQACPAGALGDLDGDGDLDALLNVSSRRAYDPQLWLNDGHAGFARHKQNLAIPAMQAYTLGDLDNDGDLDIFAGSFDRGYGIWLNDSEGNYVRTQ